MANETKTNGVKVDADAALAMLKERAEAADAELAKARAELDALNAKHAALETKHGELAEDHADLKKEHAELASENSTMEQLLTEAGAKTSTLEEQIKTAADKTGAPPAIGSALGASAPLALKADDFSGPKVRMVFAKRVKLLVDGHRFIEFQPGVQDVPVGLSDHWYLQAHGVKRLE